MTLLCYPSALFFEREYVLHGVCQRDHRIVVIDVDQLISVVPHMELLHITELSQTMSGLYSLNQSFPVIFL